MHLDSPERTIFVAGHRGMVGSAVVESLGAAGYDRLVLRTRERLDLRVQAAVEDFFQAERPDYVVLAAARVGGILANTRAPVPFLADNLAIAQNVIESAQRSGVKRLLFLGSSCVYPKHAPQPMKEADLLSGPLEPTNQWYAIAKIAGIKLCQAYREQLGEDFVSLMPTNLYGPRDNFDLETSHVLPALIRKFHEAKGRDGAEDRPVTLWGSGEPRREFLYSEDLARACVFLLEVDEDRLWTAAPDGIVNVGVGRDLAIAELAERIRSLVGSTSAIELDRSKPDGTPRKLLDVSRMEALGWTASTPLDEGLLHTYRWFLDHVHA
jgi:GDP-L-fucose synthase